MKKSLHLCSLKLLVIALCVAGSVQHADAQLKYEIGINLGPMNFLGDLGGTQGRGQTFLKDNNYQMYRMMKGITFNLIPNEVITFRVAVNVGTLEGADSIIQGKGGLEEARRARNQHFKSSLFEAFAATEIYPTALLEEDPSDLVHKLRPYGLLGVGVFKFNPQAQYTAPDGSKKWVDLQPLRTEGQGMSKYPEKKEYNLTQINIPYGIGIKYFISDRFNLAFEIVNRKTFTDYVDDVSTTYIADQDFYDHFGAGETADIARQVANMSTILTGGLNRPGYSAGDKRGTATNNDAYYATTFKLGMRLGNDGGSRYRNQTRCPVVRF
ncbi:MAG TPA: hypothetical protein VLA58_01655 [Chitinophagaceae bacterium]|nr:hypothetical protein [Chitinophagaceae bacterium]